jgi:hypothetical protein
MKRGSKKEKGKGYRSTLFIRKMETSSSGRQSIFWLLDLREISPLGEGKVDNIPKNNRCSNQVVVFM